MSRDVAIPARLAFRPTVGGLVVPHISVVQRDGRPVLGAVHRNKAMRCISEYRCQICGKPLMRPIVVLVSDDGLAECYSGEAALHPECAAYSTRACPFLNGRQAAYREVDRHVGGPCPDRDCDCGGWVDGDPDRPSKRGEVASDWWSVWLGERYAIAVNDAREVHGLSWQGLNPLKVRQVRQGALRPDTEGGQE